jgi:hypothetical protein
MEMTMLSFAKVNSGVALRGLLVALLLLLLTVVAVYAQETTGTPGSPSVTITIDGKQLPPRHRKAGALHLLSMEKQTSRILARMSGFDARQKALNGG